MGNGMATYSIYDTGYSNVQIRENNETEINIVATMPRPGGEFITNQSRKEGLKLAQKIVRLLNKRDIND